MGHLRVVLLHPMLTLHPSKEVSGHFSPLLASNQNGADKKRVAVRTSSLRFGFSTNRPIWDNGIVDLDM